MQREIPLMEDMERKPADLPTIAVKSCNTFQSALRLCVERSDYDQETAGELMGYDKSSFSRICGADSKKTKRYRAFPPEKMHELERLCGNRAMSQWLDYEEEGLLDRQMGERELAIRYHEEQLQELKQVG